MKYADWDIPLGFKSQFAPLSATSFREPCPLILVRSSKFRPLRITGKNRGLPRGCGDEVWIFQTKAGRNIQALDVDNAIASTQIAYLPTPKLKISGSQTHVIE